MEFIDLKKQYQASKQIIDAAIQKVLDHGQYILGPEVKELETQIATRANVKHAIAMASGTTALQVALMALGIGSGDEVIMPAFSFFATAEVVLLQGATPVYVDIDPLTYNMDAALIEAAITSKTKAIMPVSMYGQCADMDVINAIAARYKLAVIEDGAQSFGATYKGRSSCGVSLIGCTSFFPSKPLGCYGDAGACFTNDDTLAERMRLLMNHGQAHRYYHTEVGINGRCDTLQAAILLAKLKTFDEEIAQRQKVAKWYDDALAHEMRTPRIADYNHSVFAQYTVQVSKRDEMRRRLDSQGVPTAVHYPMGLHQQPASKTHCKMPVTETTAKRVLSLPFHPYLTREDVQKITSILKENYAVLRGVAA